MAIGIIDAIIRAVLVLATGILFGSVFLAFYRLRSLKLLLISTGFGIFFIHALIYIPELFIEGFDLTLTANTHLLIHLLALIFIAFGMFKD